MLTFGWVVFFMLLLLFVSKNLAGQVSSNSQPSDTNKFPHETVESAVGVWRETRVVEACACVLRRAATVVDFQSHDRRTLRLANHYGLPIETLSFISRRQELSKVARQEFSKVARQEFPAEDGATAFISAHK